MRQIKGVELARELYNTLIYPSAKNYKWVISINHIKKFPVTVHSIEVTQKVWVKNIAALKGKTTSGKSDCSGQGSSEYPCRIDKVAQGIIPHMRHLFCE